MSPYSQTQGNGVFFGLTFLLSTRTLKSYLLSPSSDIFGSNRNFCWCLDPDAQWLEGEDLNLTLSLRVSSVSPRRRADTYTIRINTPRSSYFNIVFYKSTKTYKYRKSRCLCPLDPITWQLVFGFLFYEDSLHIQIEKDLVHKCETFPFFGVRYFLPFLDPWKETLNKCNPFILKRRKESSPPAIDVSSRNILGSKQWTPEEKTSCLGFHVNCWRE